MWPLVLVFKANWLLAIYYAQEAVWLMMMLTLVMLVFCYRYFSSLAVAYCIALAGLGCSIDLSLLHFQLIGFEQPSLPVFMWLLWLSFSLLLPWFARRMGKLFIPAMIVGGPASYYFASAVGVIDFHGPLLLVLGAMALAWALYAWGAQRVLVVKHA